MHGYRLAAALVIVGVLVAAAAIEGRQTASERRLDAAIGPPILHKYESIRDAQDWLNPYLSVCPHGVVLDVRSVNRVNETVPSDSLRKALLDLPVKAWPYGRIVAVTNCSIEQPGDDEDRKKRMLEVQTVLDTLQLETNHWPSDACQWATGSRRELSARTRGRGAGSTLQRTR